MVWRTLKLLQNVPTLFNDQHMSNKAPSHLRIICLGEIVDGIANLNCVKRPNRLSFDVKNIFIFLNIDAYIPPRLAAQLHHTNTNAYDGLFELLGDAGRIPVASIRTTRCSKSVTMDDIKAFTNAMVLQNEKKESEKIKSVLDKRNQVRTIMKLVQLEEKDQKVVQHLDGTSMADLAWSRNSSNMWL